MLLFQIFFIVNLKQQIVEEKNKTSTKLVCCHGDTGFIQFDNEFHIMVIISEYLHAGDEEMAFAWGNVLFTMLKNSKVKSAQSLAYEIRGDINFSMKDYSKAICDYSMVITLKDEKQYNTLYPYYLKLGNAYRCYGDIKNSLHYYCMAIEETKDKKNIDEISSFSYITFYTLFSPANLVEYLELNREIFDDKRKLDNCIKTIKSSLISYNKWKETYVPPSYKPKFLKDKKFSTNE
jgi:tetratricopeptide (TPR) repeat protein